MRIVSPRNDRVRYARKLARRRFRQREGRFLIEGPRLVAEAIASGAAFHSVYVCPELYPGAVEDLLVGLPAHVPVYELAEGAFRAVALTDAPQGVAAVVAMRTWTWEECCRPPAVGGAELVILVDGLQDPGNLGTILRTGEALGASGVLVGAGSVDPWNPKAVRASMGAIFRFPCAVEVDLAARVGDLRRRGIQVLVAAARAATPAYAADWRRPTAVVLGNEGAGVSLPVTAQADGSVCVPMPGRAESLNAGMAAGILLYEALRQRALGGAGGGCWPPAAGGPAGAGAPPGGAAGDGGEGR